MDKIVINKNCFSNITIDKDSYVLIDNDVQAKKIEFNILNCKVKIIDKAYITNKIFNFTNCECVFVEIVNSKECNSLQINNIRSNIEYNIIDLCDENVNYKIEENSFEDGSNTKINVASICYKEKNKNYLINTSNFKANTVNEINCFGIVKDKSILNYDVTSFIQKGAKQSIVRQNSNILLFDKDSLGKNNPILVIEENDVKASHGSSIGKIDDDTMFYLCSRGLSKNDATNLICLGKINHLIEKIDDDEIKETLVNSFKERMG